MSLSWMTKVDYLNDYLENQYNILDGRFHVDGTEKYMCEHQDCCIKEWYVDNYIKARWFIFISQN